MKGFLRCFLYSRPKTWLASVSPVSLGTALAIQEGIFSGTVLMITVICALLIQVGTNLANDYYDGIKGADTAKRKGPQRLSQRTDIPLSSVKYAFIACFLGAFCLGVCLMIRGGWPIVGIGLTAIFFGVFYSKSRYALAYTGLADLICFVYFGLIASAGTYYLQTLTFSWHSVILGALPGALSVAILTVNNIRDREEDLTHKKYTLAVRFGYSFAYTEYLWCHGIAYCVIAYFARQNPLHYSLFLFIPFSCFLIYQIRKAKDLNPYLGFTALFLAVLSISMSAILIF